MASDIFRFKQNDRIGAAAAEDDHEFLSACFVDIGNLEILQDISDSRQIVVGRTGPGKSALLSKLAETKRDHVIIISPENLALTYVSNSTVINFFEELGVNLDPFFKLLWRHVFTVEILSRHFRNTEKGEPKSLFDRIASMFSGNSREDKEIQEAIKYLRQWGQSFWLETEFRVKEITQKFENALIEEAEGQLGTKFANIKAAQQEQFRLSQDQRAELCSRGQNVVSTAQVQDLHKVLKLLETVLDDKQKHYYILIDKLDENWVEEKLRYKLIMALIVTARELTRVRNVKVIVAMRRDLIDRVFRLSRDSGFQEEKYQSLYLALVWTKKDLIEVLDRRIDALVRHRYTKQKVTHRELLPKAFDDKPITDYLLERAGRPRDIISFFNKCIEAAPNLERLRVAEFKAAEGEYSRSRLRALADEWSADYPELLEFARILHQRPKSFKFSSISITDVDELCLRIAIENPAGKGILEHQALKLVDCVIATDDFKRLLIQVFYKIGLVGLKLLPHETELWAGDAGRNESAAEITDDVSVVINPTYYRALGTRV